MDKIIRNVQINKKPSILQSSNNHSYYKLHPLVATKAKNNEDTNNDNNVIDYKNISLSMTGEISSGSIHRNNLTKKQPTDVTFIEDTENADDEEFIANMKTIIDKNYKMNSQNKENFIKDLQSKSHISRKKKCAFSDEDQNLMKRFKRSVNERKASCAVVSQKLQQPEHVISVKDHNYSTTYTTQQVVPLKYNDSDISSSSNSNELFFHLASKIQKNDQCVDERISGNTKTVTEIEQLIYNEMLYITPPQKDNYLLRNS